MTLAVGWMLGAWVSMLHLQCCIFNTWVYICTLSPPVCWRGGNTPNLLIKGAFDPKSAPSHCIISAFLAKTRRHRSFLAEGCQSQQTLRRLTPAARKRLMKCINCGRRKAGVAAGGGWVPGCREMLRTFPVRLHLGGGKSIPRMLGGVLISLLPLLSGGGGGWGLRGPEPAGLS